MSYLLTILKLLDRSERIKGLLIVVFTLFCACLEMFSVMAVVPFVEVLTRGTIITYPMLQSWISALGYGEHPNLLIAVSLLLFASYGVKTVANIILIYTQNRYAFSKQNDLGKRLFEIYLHKPYVYFHEINTAEIQKNIVNTVIWAIQNTLIPTLCLISEGLAFLMIALLLFLTDIKSTALVFLIFATVFGLLAKPYREKIDYAGRLQNASVNSEIFWISQTFSAIKDVKIFEKETYFYKQFAKASKDYSDAGSAYFIVSQLPRTVIEITAVFSITAIVVMTAYSEGYSQNVLSTLGLFAVAAFRVMPSMNRISNYISAIRFYSHCVEDVAAVYSQDVENLRQHSIENLKNHVSYEDVSFSHVGSDKVTLKDINLKISRGESLGIIGPSGSGKTTLVDLLMGLFDGYSGRITIDGNDIRSHLSSWRSQIGYIPQQIQMIDGTIISNVAFGIDEHEIDLSKVDEALMIAQMLDFVSSLPEKGETYVGEGGVKLSGGQRQRLGIARALYRNPQIIIMDEATSALDNETEAAFTDAINQLIGEKTMIIIAHRLSTVEKCDRIIRLVEGEIVEVINRTERM